MKYLVIPVVLEARFISQVSIFPVGLGPGRHASHSPPRSAAHLVPRGEKATSGSGFVFG